MEGFVCVHMTVRRGDAGQVIWVCVTLGAARQAGSAFRWGTKYRVTSSNSFRSHFEQSPFGFRPEGRLPFVWVRYAFIDNEVGSLCAS